METECVYNDEKATTFYGLISKFRTEIMGFAAILIYLFHNWVSVGEISISGINLTYSIVQTLFYGVDIFLFLSGFGLVSSIENNSIMAFYKKRFVRVYIPFFIAGGSIALIQGWNIKEFVMRISGYSFYHDSIFSLLWFVPAIMTIYLFFPLYYRLIKASTSKTAFTIVALVVWFLLAMSFRSIIREDLYGFINRIPVFLLGCLAGFWRDDNTKLTHERKVMIFALLLAGYYSMYLCFCEGVEFILPYTISGVPACLIGCSMPICVGCVMEWIYQKKAGKIICFIFKFFGKMSLEFYCVQEAVNQVVRDLLSNKMGVLTVNFIVLFLSIVAGYLLYLISGIIRKAFSGRTRFHLPSCLCVPTRILREKVKTVFWVVFSFVFILFVVTPVYIQDIYDSPTRAESMPDSKNFSTIDICLPAGDYEVVLEYDTEKESDLIFIPYGDDEQYPVTLSGDDDVLTFPLSLGKDTQALRFDYSDPGLKIDRIHIIKRKLFDGTIHYISMVSLLILTVLAVYYWPIVNPLKREKRVTKEPSL